MSDTLDKVKEFKATQLRELLAQCTEEQQKMFSRMYPEGIENIPDKSYSIAVSQCEATIAKNKLKSE